MEKQSVATERAEKEIIQHFNILGSEGIVYKCDGKIFWSINGTVKEPHETEPVWPIIDTEITRIKEAGSYNNIDHIRISPAVAIHLVFEQHLHVEGLKNTSGSDNETVIDHVQFIDLPDYTNLIFIVERNMLQKRNGTDILILDKNGQQL
jgi:hypothetical protein